MYAFRPSMGRWQKVPRAKPAAPVDVSKLRVATYNVWFDPFESERRCAAVLSILQRENPDLIALEEVNAPFLERLLASAWVRQNYQVSQARLEAGRHYDVVMLSRLPVTRFTAHLLPSTMGRRLHLLELSTSIGTLAVAGVHLESMREMTPARLEQIEIAMRVLSRPDGAIWLGDFNAAPGSAEDDLIRTAFRDAWDSLSKGPGYTRDTSRNTMLAQVKADRHQRIDRIWVRGEVVWPKSIRLLGTRALAGTEGRVFPSDHFGLTADILLREPELAAVRPA